MSRPIFSDDRKLGIICYYTLHAVQHQELGSLNVNLNQINPIVGVYQIIKRQHLYFGFLRSLRIEALCFDKRAMAQHTSYEEFAMLANGPYSRAPGLYMSHHPIEHQCPI